MGQMRSFGPSRCSAFLVGKAVSTLRSATALQSTRVYAQCYRRVNIAIVNSFLSFPLVTYARQY